MLVSIGPDTILTSTRARVLLEVATHHLLIPHLQRPLLEILQQALEAHRYALALDQENPDTLFNTAQVLTAIAEAFAKDPNHPDGDALQPLEEALELQNRCLSIQEVKYEEHIEQQNEAAQLVQDEPNERASNAEDDIIEADTEAASAAGAENQWFSVVEPVTKATLIDTILTQLGTLTTLCSVLSLTNNSATSSTLAWIEEYSTKLVQTKLPVLLQGADPETAQEVALARANFVSELLKAGYVEGSIDTETYKREREEAFRVAGLDLERSFAALMANANSLIAFATVLSAGNASNVLAHAALRWSSLSAAIANLATASKLSDPLPDDIAETHFLRGNCSLLQYQLGQPPVSHGPAVANSKQLTRNAETFYRNANRLYQDNEQKMIAQLRAVVVESLQTGTSVITTAIQRNSGMPQDWIKAQLEDMVDDGLISVEM